MSKFRASGRTAYEGNVEIGVMKGREQAARIVALLNAREWQPIETAPKDGTPILLWAPGWKFANCGWWQTSINGSDDAGWTDGTVISWNYQENSTLLPTLWQPLPDPHTSEREPAGRESK